MHNNTHTVTFLMNKDFYHLRFILKFRKKIYKKKPLIKWNKVTIVFSKAIAKSMASRKH